MFHFLAEFPYAGQNIAQGSVSAPVDITESEIKATITNHFNAWFKEFKDTTLNHINRYPKSHNG